LAPGLGKEHQPKAKKTLRDLYWNVNRTFPGVEELVITAKEIKLPPSGPWQVLAGGTLLENGVPKTVQGLQVFVRSIAEHFPK
jgi:hypothetical protein